ncbi:uncharacterized protein C1orf112 homolog isoform X2 [Biomphalaria glabrata]|uniref:Uncharacterized protein C1orf112 homolog isoform X2 n=1 Tax=Biomphalaria glabrata TaxID=6526 RepID=A0A9W3BET1_BIOGL|nr:uncharacterized protein C1orf112 homolog isoform X2 [Biomphalaria glabrata]
MVQKSYSNLVTEVCGWSKETCLKNVETTLPSALNILEDSLYKPTADNIGLLKVICHSLLPCLPCQELEEKVFRKLCPAMMNFIHNILDIIDSNLTDQRNETDLDVKALLSEHLEYFINVNQCVDQCIKCAMSVSVDLSWVQSLPGCAVHVLLQAYKHCKTSSQLYGEILNLFSEQLSILFKTAHALQTSLLGLLDNVCITGAPLEEHVSILCSVCTTLYEVCCVVSSLDIKLVISLLRGISRLSSQHLSLLQDRLDVSPIIKYLCHEIGQGYEYLFELCGGTQTESLSQGDDKTFDKLVKVLGFQMKVMVALLRDYSKYLDNCEKNVVDLLLCFHRLLPPSLSAKSLSEKQMASVKLLLINATAPIVSHLITNKALRRELTSNHSADDLSEDNFPKLILQLMVLDMLPKFEADVFDSWLAPVNYQENVPTLSLLAAIFHSVQMCEVEMRYPVMLAGVVVAGKPQRQVSLYEHVATHLCGFIGACPARHFSLLESTLLEHVLGRSTLSSLLAADCWCFLARYGTANLCRDQVQGLVKLYLQLKNTSNKTVLFRLESLLHRLIKLMARDHQNCLVEMFPPEEEPMLWVAVTPNCLHENLGHDVRNKLLQWSVNVVNSSSVKLSHLLTALDFLTNVVSNSPSQCSPTHQELIVHFVNQMSIQLQVHCALTHSQEILVAKLVLLAGSVLQQLSTKSILQVLVVIQKCLEEKISLSFCLSVVHFLVKFSKCKIEPCFEQSQVLEKLSKVFHHMLSHPSALVHHAALSAFADFASHTIHETAIPACIQGEQWLQQRVERFLNKCPHKPAKQFDLVTFLRSNLIEASRIKTDTACTSETLNQEKGMFAIELEHIRDTESEPPTKKIKLKNTSDENDTEKFPKQMLPSSQQFLLQRIISLADDLEKESSQSTLTPEFVDSAKLAVARINECLVLNQSWFDSLS